MPRRPLSAATISILLLLVAASLAVAYLVDRQHNELPLEISRIDVAGSATASPALLVAGSGFDHRTTEGFLVPTPAQVDSEAGILVPRTTLFKLAVDGEIAVAMSRGQRLVTINITPGRPPRVLGSLDLVPGDDRFSGVSAMIRVGDRVIVSFTRNQGLALVDVADPAAPHLLDVLREPANFTEMLAIKGCIVAAGVQSGLWQVHIAGDRLRLSKVPGPKRAWRLSGDGKRLATVSLQGELALYEFDGAAAPRLVSLQQLSAEIRGVALGAETLHLCFADGTLREYALAGWPRLEPRGELQLPGRPIRLIRDVNATQLLCTLVGVGAALIDVSDPGSPVVAGWLPSGSAINDLVIAGDRVLYVNLRGLQTRDFETLRRNTQLTVTVPLGTSREFIQLTSWQGEALAYDSRQIMSLGRNPVRKHGEPPSTEALLAVLVDGEVHLYARRGDALARVARHPLTQKIVEEEQKRWAAIAVLARGRSLYVLNKTSLDIFACDETGIGEQLGHLEGFTNAQTFTWVEPGYLLVADRQAGVKLVSVRDAVRPGLVAHLPIPAFLQTAGVGAYDVQVRGQRAFVARGAFGVEMLNLSDPTNPQPLQLLDTPGNVYRLGWHDDLLLAADRTQGIQVIDTRGGWCRLLGTMAHASHVDDLVSVGNEILVNSAWGVVSRLPAPLRLGNVQVLGDGAGRLTLPEGLPAGRYQLVICKGEKMARADFTLR